MGSPRPSDSPPASWTATRSWSCWPTTSSSARSAHGRRLPGRSARRPDPAHAGGGGRAPPPPRRTYLRRGRQDRGHHREAGAPGVQVRGDRDLLLRRRRVRRHPHARPSAAASSRSPTSTTTTSPRVPWPTTCSRGSGASRRVDRRLLHGERLRPPPGPTRPDRRGPGGRADALRPPTAQPSGTPTHSAVSVRCRA